MLHFHIGSELHKSPPCQESSPWQRGVRRSLSTPSIGRTNTRNLRQVSKEESPRLPPTLGGGSRVIRREWNNSSTSNSSTPDLNGSQEGYYSRKHSSYELPRTPEKNIRRIVKERPLLKKKGAISKIANSEMQELQRQVDELKKKLEYETKELKYVKKRNSALEIELEEIKAQTPRKDPPTKEGGRARAHSVEMKEKYEKEKRVQDVPLSRRSYIVRKKVSDENSPSTTVELKKVFADSHLVKEKNLRKSDFAVKTPKKPKPPPHRKKAHMESSDSQKLENFSEEKKKKVLTEDVQVRQVKGRGAKKKTVKVGESEDPPPPTYIPGKPLDFVREKYENNKEDLFTKIYNKKGEFPSFDAMKASIPFSKTDFPHISPVYYEGGEWTTKTLEEAKTTAAAALRKLETSGCCGRPEKKGLEYKTLLEKTEKLVTQIGRLSRDSSFTDGLLKQLNTLAGEMHKWLEEHRGDKQSHVIAQLLFSLLESHKQLQTGYNLYHRHKEEPCLRDIFRALAAAQNPPVLGAYLEEKGIKFKSEELVSYKEISRILGRKKIRDDKKDYPTYFLKPAPPPAVSGAKK